MSGGSTLALMNLIDNPLMTDAAEALYLDKLFLEAGATLDLGGLNLYYCGGRIDPSATIVGGTVTFVPEPALVWWSVLVWCYGCRRFASRRGLAA